ncbi:MAG: hypothetical protein LBM00_11925 [Deltaproteobacteria bacterium]|jgi:hypothetical protein|nr:hypothetical protein [Deltaproteobacteria bacterium]
MPRPVHAVDFMARLADIKRENSHYITNLFKWSPEVRNLVEQGALFFSETPGCILVGIPVRNAFIRLYYCATAANRLSKALGIFCQAHAVSLPLICDIIGREASVRKSAAIFLHNGFSVRRRLRRVEATESRRFVDMESSAEFAKTEDAEKIAEILGKEFDIYLELPSAEELQQWLARREGILIRKGRNIIALHLFSIRGRCLHGRFAWVNEAYRRTPAFLELNAMLLRILRERRIVRVYGWRDEARSLRACPALGEKPEDMVDYIMLREGKA